MFVFWPNLAIFLPFGSHHTPQRLFCGKRWRSAIWVWFKTFFYPNSLRLKMGTLALLNTFLHKSITKIPNENLDFQVYTHKIGKSEISHHFTRVHSMDVMKSTNTLVIMQRTRIRVMDMAGPLFTHPLLLEMWVYSFTLKRIRALFLKSNPSSLKIASDAENFEFIELIQSTIDEDKDVKV